MQRINLAEEKSEIKESLKDDFEVVFSDDLSKKLDEELQLWQDETNYNIEKENTFIKFRSELEGYKLKVKNKFETKEQVKSVKGDKFKLKLEARLKRSKLTEKQKDYQKIVEGYQIFLNQVRKRFDSRFWNEKLINEENSKEQEITCKLLFSQWEELLDKEEANWKIHYIESARKEIFNRLKTWLGSIKNLKESFDLFGLDFGVWFDLSQGSLQPQDISQLQNWAQYLSNDEDAQTISNLLGRMREIEFSEDIDKVQKTFEIKSPVIDYTSKEEIIGIKFSNNLDLVLPSELSLLSTDETSILFDLKYLESTLLSFDMQGTSLINTTIKQEVEENIKSKENMGPMLLCVDTSGSMSGLPEKIAKAMALFLATKAKEQKRKCYLINFSSSIVTHELTGENGIEKLIDFLRSSFHGGTDVAPALSHALKMMGEDDYKKADVLIISDFIMANLSDALLNSIKKQRLTGNKFYSLVVGNTFLRKISNTYFDKEWVYNPNNSLIQELVHFKEKVFQKNS